MKVLCRKILYLGEEVEDHPSITIGQPYVVIGLSCHPGSDPAVQVVGDGGIATQWPAQMFITEDTRIPSNWVADVQATGHVNVAPEAWLRPGFWETLFGRNEASPEERRQARLDYKRELEIIEAES